MWINDLGIIKRSILRVLVSFCDPLICPKYATIFVLLVQFLSLSLFDQFLSIITRGAQQAPSPFTSDLFKIAVGLLFV
jgi:hypothetical protein